jgi:hypothetical protein
MHDWDWVASHAFVGIFRKAEEGAVSSHPVPVVRNASERKDCQMQRVRNDHHAPASNEGRCS